MKVELETTIDSKDDYMIAIFPSIAFTKEKGVKTIHVFWLIFSLNFAW